MLNLVLSTGWAVRLLSDSSGINGYSVSHPDTDTGEYLSSATPRSNNQSDMNAEIASYMRQEYGLHTCGHCQLVLIDLKDLQNTSTSTPDQNHVNDLCRISISGPQVFAAANDGCPFFLFCTQNINCPPGKSQEFKFALPSAEMADSLALVIRVRKAAGAGGPNVSCLVAWDRCDKYPMHPIFYQHLSRIFSLHVPKGGHSRFIIKSAAFFTDTHLT